MGVSCNANLRDQHVTTTITFSTRTKRKSKDPPFQLHKVLHQEQLYHLLFSTTLQYCPVLQGIKKKSFRRKSQMAGQQVLATSSTVVLDLCQGNYHLHKKCGGTATYQPSLPEYWIQSFFTYKKIIDLEVYA